MTPTLKQGEWVPSLQFSGGDQLTQNAAMSFFPRAATAYEDLLKNEQQSPMVVRALSMIIDWSVAHTTTAVPMEFEVKYRRRGVPIALHPQPLKSPPSNWQTGLYGTTAVVAKPWVFKLAAPFRLRAGENILLTAALNLSEDFVLPGAPDGTEVVGDTLNGAFVGVGRSSGLQRRMAIPQTTVLVAFKGIVVKSQYDEDIDITHMVWAGGSGGGANAYRYWFRVEAGGRAWSKGARPMWMYAEPFLRSRLDFSRLPEGGLVLFPGDGFEVGVRNTQYATGPYYGVALDAYQQVA